VQAVLSVLPGVRDIFVFGSRARGDNKNPLADIDLGVIADKKLDASQIIRTEEALDEINTLYSIDFCDFTQSNDEFSNAATMNKVIIYEKR